MADPLEKSTQKTSLDSREAATNVSGYIASHGSARVISVKRFPHAAAWIEAARQHSARCVKGSENFLDIQRLW